MSSARPWSARRSGWTERMLVSALLLLLGSLWSAHAAELTAARIFSGRGHARLLIIYAGEAPEVETRSLPAIGDMPPRGILLLTGTVLADVESADVQENGVSRMEALQVGDSAQITVTLSRPPARALLRADGRRHPRGPHRRGQGRGPRAPHPAADPRLAGGRVVRSGGPRDPTREPPHRRRRGTWGMGPRRRRVHRHPRGGRRPPDRSPGRPSAGGGARRRGHPHPGR